MSLIDLEPLKPLAEVAKDFLQKVITPPLEEVGGLLADKIKLWRYKNQVDILTKAEQYLRSKNLETKKVSLKVLTPLLEYSGIEEEETLQNKWAALLANTVRKDSNYQTTLFTHILSQLSIPDAKLFEEIYSKCHVKINKAGKYIQKPWNPEIVKLKSSSEDMELSMDNLHRLRLITLDPLAEPNNKSSTSIRITYLAIQFRKACSFT